MPQGRRKDFSGKKKKLQLKEKRQRHQLQDRYVPEDRETIRGPTVAVRSPTGDQSEKSLLLDKASVDQLENLVDSVRLSTIKNKSGRQKYELKFRVESKDEIKKLREEARKNVQRRPENDPDVMTYFPESLEFPTRPKWLPMMSKEQVERNEEQRLREFIKEIVSRPGEQSVSHFEMNLETWRQLWRVLERSDILLLIVDCRYPRAMFPPMLFKYIQSFDKDMILVLNKIDLITPELALAWKDYFEQTYIGLKVAFFSSCPNYNLRVKMIKGGVGRPGLQYRHQKGRIRMVTDGALNVFEACRDLVARANAEVDLDSWEKLIEEKGDNQSGFKGSDTVTAVSEDLSDVKCGSDQVRFKEKTLTLGMVGQPNAGKSSLINSLVGKKVVSVSKTPGHTKHFQTIYVTKSVILCDCPGLVFPSLVPKPLQVIMGSYPISQVREPFSVVQYLAERVDLPKILKVDHPSEKNNGWSAFDICEAWALKRGYVSARSNRPDMNRAANHILRMTLEGKITLALIPPEYCREKYDKDPRLDAIEKLLGLIDENKEELLESSSDNAEICSQSEDGRKDESKCDDDVRIVPMSNKFSFLCENESSSNSD